jgi:hypothetical protein
MKVKYLTGPRTGQADHLIYNQTTQALIDTGLIQVLADARRGTNECLQERAALSAKANPLPPPTITWNAGRTKLNETVTLTGSCSRGCQLVYQGLPARLFDDFQRRNCDGFYHLYRIKLQHGCGAPAENVPDAVAKQYEAEKSREHITSISADEGVMYQIQAHKGTDNQPRYI